MLASTDWPGLSNPEIDRILTMLGMPGRGRPEQSAPGCGRL
jgi:hypothetical protein